MTEEEARKRFHIFAALRLVGVGMFLLGVFIALTDLVEPGGSPVIGAIVAIIGATEAMFAAKILKTVLGNR